MRLSEKPPLKSQRILLQFQLPIKLWLLSADVSHAIAKALNCDATALTALAIINGKPAEGYEVSLRQVDNGRLTGITARCLPPERESPWLPRLRAVPSRLPMKPR